MAKAAEDVLGDLIAESQINAKKGEPRWCSKINVTFAGHPIPDEDSVEGSKRIVSILRKAKKDDIVIYAASGGASALTTLPGPGLTLEDLQEVNRLLFFECSGSTLAVCCLAFSRKCLLLGRILAVQELPQQPR